MYHFAYINFICTTSATFMWPSGHFTYLPVYLIQFRLFHFTYITWDKAVFFNFISCNYSLHFFKTYLELDKTVSLYFIQGKN
jgi:hypothetical protein